MVQELNLNQIVSKLREIENDLTDVNGPFQEFFTIVGSQSVKIPLPKAHKTLSLDDFRNESNWYQLIQYKRELIAIHNKVTKETTIQFPAIGESVEKKVPSWIKKLGGDLKPLIKWVVALADKVALKGMLVDKSAEISLWITGLENACNNDQVANANKTYNELLPIEGDLQGLGIDGSIMNVARAKFGNALIPVAQETATEGEA